MRRPTASTVVLYALVFFACSDRDGDDKWYIGEDDDSGCASSSSDDGGGCSGSSTDWDDDDQNTGCGTSYRDDDARYDDDDGWSCLNRPDREGLQVGPAPDRTGRPVPNEGQFDVGRPVDGGDVSDRECVRVADVIAAPADDVLYAVVTRQSANCLGPAERAVVRIPWRRSAADIDVLATLPTGDPTQLDWAATPEALALVAWDAERVAITVFDHALQTPDRIVRFGPVEGTGDVVVDASSSGRFVRVTRWPEGDQVGADPARGDTLVVDLEAPRMRRIGTPDPATVGIAWGPGDALFAAYPGDGDTVRVDRFDVAATDAGWWSNEAVADADPQWPVADATFDVAVTGVPEAIGPAWPHVASDGVHLVLVEADAWPDGRTRDGLVVHNLDDGVTRRDLRLRPDVAAVDGDVLFGEAIDRDDDGERSIVRITLLEGDLGDVGAVPFTAAQFGATTTFGLVPVGDRQAVVSRTSLNGAPIERATPLIADVSIGEVEPVRGRAVRLDDRVVFADRGEVWLADDTLHIIELTNRAMVEIPLAYRPNDVVAIDDAGLVAIPAGDAPVLVVYDTANRETDRVVQIGWSDEAPRVETSELLGE